MRICQGIEGTHGRMEKGSIFRWYPPRDITFSNPGPDILRINGGISVGKVDGRIGMVVHRVDPGSFFAEDGITPGQVMEAVNGKSCDDMSLEQLRQLLTHRARIRFSDGVIMVGDFNAVRKTTDRSESHSTLGDIILKHVAVPSSLEKRRRARLAFGLDGDF